jgi:hypothetical protein
MTAERDSMRRASRGGLGVLVALLAGCGPDWQPSWSTSSRPPVPGDSLTIRRVTGQEAAFEPLQPEPLERLRLSAGELRAVAPTGPDAAMTAVPEYRPVPRPGLDAPPMPRQGSSTPPAPMPPARPSAGAARPPAAAPDLPPVERVEGTPVQLPGQPAGVVTGGTGRVQAFSQPGNPAGGTALRDGGTTTVIQPGGRVTTIPTPR